MMKTLNFYKYAALGLLLLNIGLLAFFFMNKPKGGPPKHIRKQVKEILNLNPQQKAAFEGLVEDHKAAMLDIQNAQEQQFQAYFYTLRNSVGAAPAVEHLDSLQHLERKKIETTYEHFVEVRALLDDKQKADYPKFVQLLVDNVLLNRKAPKKPK